MDDNIQFELNLTFDLDENFAEEFFTAQHRSGLKLKAFVGCVMGLGLSRITHLMDTGEMPQAGEEGQNTEEEPC